MRDRYGKPIEVGDSIQFDPKHLGSPDGQIRAVVVGIRGGLAANGDTPPHEVMTLTFTQQIPVPLGVNAMVAIVQKDPELGRKIEAGSGRGMIV